VNSLGDQISFIGVWVQVGGTFLLLTLFYVLARHAGTRPYFIRWAWGWLALLVGLVAVTARYVLAPLLPGEPSPLTFALHSSYLFAKLIFFAFIASGTWLFCEGRLPPGKPAYWAAAAAVLSLIASVGTTNMTPVMLVQQPIAAGAYGLLAIMLFRLPAGRRTMGTKLTAGVMAVQSGLWILYGATYWISAFGLSDQMPWSELLAEGNSYIDLALGAVMAYGMVVILLEDTRRETDEARAEQLSAVAESEARIKAVIETATDGIIVADGEGKVVLANAASARLFGRKRAEMLGQPLAAFFPEPTRDELGRRLLDMRRITPGRQAVFEVMGSNAQGGEVPLEVAASTLIRPGTELEILVLRDLTDRRRAESDREQLQSRLAQSVRMEALGRLVSGVAHELNNPLAAILTFSEQLLTEQPKGEFAGPLRTIREQARRARAIVRDLLTFVRRREERREPAEIGLLVERTVRALEADLARQAVSLSITIEPGLPLLMCDPTAIEQVLTNLLDNAARAATTGAVSLDIRRERDGLRITVEDTGSGIPPAHLSRIFEPFFTTRGTGEGTGLGLSVSLGIVQQHGGALRAENREPGPGARFIAWLPLGTPSAVPHGAPRVSGPVPVQGTPPSATGEVLIIDDEEAIRSSMRRYFERQGWSVEEAADGALGLAKLLATREQKTYDLIICDLKMPGLTGLEVHHWVSASRPDLLNRLVFASGDTASPETAAFLSSSGCPVLEKPFELRELAAVITRVRGAAA
jgi:PAS domain S-box-containing protein